MTCNFLGKFRPKLTAILQSKVAETWFSYQKLSFDLRVKIKQFLEV